MIDLPKIIPNEKIDISVSVLIHMRMALWIFGKKKFDPFIDNLFLGS